MVDPPNDRVVIPEPEYSLYAGLVTFDAGVADFVSLHSSSHWDLDPFVLALPGAAMVIF